MHQYKDPVSYHDVKFLSHDINFNMHIYHFHTSDQGKVSAYTLYTTGSGMLTIYT